MNTESQLSLHSQSSREKTKIKDKKTGPDNAVLPIVKEDPLHPDTIIENPLFISSPLSSTQAVAPLPIDSKQLEEIKMQPMNATQSTPLLQSPNAETQEQRSLVTNPSANDTSMQRDAIPLVATTSVSVSTEETSALDTKANIDVNANADANDNTSIATSEKPLSTRAKKSTKKNRSATHAEVQYQTPNRSLAFSATSAAAKTTAEAIPVASTRMTTIVKPEQEKEEENGDKKEAKDKGKAEIHVKDEVLQAPSSSQTKANKDDGTKEIGHTEALKAVKASGSKRGLNNDGNASGTVKKKGAPKNNSASLVRKKGAKPTDSSTTTASTATTTATTTTTTTTTATKKKRKSNPDIRKKQAAAKAGSSDKQTTDKAKTQDEAQDQTQKQTQGQSQTQGKPKGKAKATTLRKEGSLKEKKRELDKQLRKREEQRKEREQREQQEQRRKQLMRTKERQRKHRTQQRQLQRRALIKRRSPILPKQELAMVP
ncbi:adenylate kinase, partial [Reticulomyxa filosa]